MKFLTFKTGLRFSRAFTMPEILVAVAIFAAVTTIVAGLYSQSFRENRKANVQNQIYEDARFIMSRLSQEIQNGTIDYDEYYSWNVARATNYGQNYGKYHSAFFYPGADNKLGFTCNDGRRNIRSPDCIPLRGTLDKNVGSNPFVGKYSFGGQSENNYFNGEDAFCGNISYNVAPGAAKPVMTGLCGGTAKDRRTVSELFLISANGTQKTILARERIGGTKAAGVYALSILRMKGNDTNSDGVPDSFVCADDFQCTTGLPNCDKANPNVPRDKTDELNPPDPVFNAEIPNVNCDNATSGFSKDFVPISPLTVNITDLQFYINPVEDPHYAFAEANAQQQPSVTVVMTVEPNAERLGTNENFQSLTLTETVTSRVLTAVPASVLEQP